MRITRIFYPNEIAVNAEIVLDIGASSHLLKVLRLELNTLIVLFNGRGGEFIAKLTTQKNNRAIIRVISFVAKELESPIKIHLAQGIGRGEKMDYIIQKAVELGIHKITPLFTEYCNVKLDLERTEKRLAHWQSIIISACEQSGRNYLPKIADPKNLSDWFFQEQNSLKLILDPGANKSLADIPVPNSEITILIGPEGGLSTNEIELAKKNNFIAVRLGARILRTETAALATISALQTKFGDFTT